MTNLNATRKKFVTVLTVLGVVTVGLLGYLFWPGRSNQKDRETQVLQLQNERDQKKKQVAPIADIEKKLAQARVDIKKFYTERVPSRWSSISEQIDKLARAHGVTAQGTRYKTEDSGLPNLERVDVETTISGDYAKIAHFINALERDKVLFLINEVSLSSPQGGVVDLRIKFQTFLKEAA